MNQKTVFNLFIFAVILCFFFTPLGYESKILLQRIFANSANIIPQNQQYTIDENWILKDRNHKPFNFNQSQGRVRFVYFWASWQSISIADLGGIQQLYDDYHQKIDFYIITNELPEPVEQKMKDRKYHFQVTYLIMDEKIPFDTQKIPSGYIIDQKAKVVAYGHGSTRWNSQKIRNLLDNLIENDTSLQKSSE